MKRPCIRSMRFRFFVWIADILKCNSLIDWEHVVALRDAQDRYGKRCENCHQPTEGCDDDGVPLCAVCGFNLQIEADREKDSK